MEMLFSAIGLILTIVFAEPIWHSLKYTMSKIQRRVWSAEQYRKGNISNLRHYGFEDWSVLIRVDAEGSTKHEFDAKIVNLSQDLLKFLYIPFFSDAGNATKNSIQPWAAFGKKTLPIHFDTIDEKRSQGRLSITHTPPLKPGERRRIRWGFTLPKVFSAGDDYFNWDVEVPYYEMIGKLEFDESWKVLYARWDISKIGHFDPPQFQNATINWKVMLPEPGTRLHLKLGLAKTADDGGR